MKRGGVPFEVELLVVQHVVFDGHTVREAAARYKIGVTTVHGILVRNGWRAVGKRTIWQNTDGTTVGGKP